MAGASKIDKLPEAIRDEIAKLLEQGLTLDEIHGRLSGAGVDVSRTGLGREKQRHDTLARRITETREAASAIIDQLGPAAEDDMGRVLVELLYAFLFSAAQEKEPSTKEIMGLAKAVRDVTATKRGILILEDETRKKRTEKAVRTIEEAARKQGLSEDATRAIRAAIEGKP